MLALTAFAADETDSSLSTENIQPEIMLADNGIAEPEPTGCPVCEGECTCSADVQLECGCINVCICPEPTGCVCGEVCTCGEDCFCGEECTCGTTVQPECNGCQDGVLCQKCNCTGHSCNCQTTEPQPCFCGEEDCICGEDCVCTEGECRCSTEEPPEEPCCGCEDCSCEDCSCDEENGCGCTSAVDPGDEYENISGDAYFSIYYNSPTLNLSDVRAFHSDYEGFISNMQEAILAGASVYLVPKGDVAGSSVRISVSERTIPQTAGTHNVTIRIVYHADGNNYTTLVLVHVTIIDDTQPEHPGNEWGWTKPSDKEKPTEPDPNKPGETEEPEKPVEPPEPEEPSVPDEPNNPGGPEVPNKPEGSDGPDNPEQPDEPNVPQGPENPEQPETPQPVGPTNQNSSGTGASQTSHAQPQTLGTTLGTTLDTEAQDKPADSGEPPEPEPEPAEESPEADVSEQTAAGVPPPGISFELSANSGGMDNDTKSVLTPFSVGVLSVSGVLSLAYAAALIPDLQVLHWYRMKRRARIWK